MKNFLIFNSEENYNENLTLVLQRNNEEYMFVSPKITIWSILNEFVQVDLYLENILDINKLETLSEIINEEKIHILIYPDYKNQKTFFDFILTNQKIHECNKNVNDMIRCFNLYCCIDFNLSFNNNFIENFRENYNQIAKDVHLLDAEIQFIKNTMVSQYQEHWFNDQNILVENEYNRMLNIINKKILKKKKNIDFDPSILKVINGPLDPLKTLDNVIGLENIKNEIKKLKSTLKYREKRKENGDDITYEDNLHMCFYGNPGTGKTTIARIMTGLLYEMGYIKENKCIEINGLELKGSNVGQTSIITKSIIDYAKGGVLFIDEAYTLNDENEENFGKEAVNIFLKEMEDNRGEIVFIFAGYRKPMEQLLEYNSGFRSRIKKYFDFEDYNTLELAHILIQSLKNKHLYITEDALRKCLLIIKNAQHFKDFGNGRYIRNLLETIEENHILNTINTKDMQRMDTINSDDVTEISIM